MADRHARRRQQIHVGSLPRLQSNLVTGRPADLLPIEQFKHLLTIGYRRHARASPAERANDDLPIGTCRRTEAFFSTPGPRVRSTDLWYVPLGADRTPHPFVQTAFQERDGQFSPDGKWVAYQSNDAGHFEIYLQPFPGPGDRIQVSAGGGQQVRWARNGSELFYIAADQRLTSVRVTFGANGKLVLGAPFPLFRTEFDTSFMTRQQYVVSPDGQRFLINAATDAIDPPSITLILNWKATP